MNPRPISFVAIGALTLALLSAAVPPVQALDPSAAVDGTCGTNQIVPYVECVINNIVPTDEINYIVSYEGNVTDQANGWAVGSEVQVVSATTVFASQEGMVTFKVVTDAEANEAALVVYANGQPSIVVSYANGASNGECSFWLGTPCPTTAPCACLPPNAEQVPVFPDPAPPGPCDPNGGQVPYLVCVAETVVFNTAAHYDGVVSNARTFVSSTETGALAAGSAFLNGEVASASNFATGSEGAISAYEGSLVGTAQGVGPEASYVYGKECDLVGVPSVPGVSFDPCALP